VNRAVGSVDPGAAALSDRLLDVAERSVAGSGGGASTRDDDNRRDDNVRFAEKERDTDFQLRHGVQYFPVVLHVSVQAFLAQSPSAHAVEFPLRDALKKAWGLHHRGPH